jgi:hypothetical protein
LSNRFILNAGFLLIGIIAIVFLTKSGYNSDTKQVDRHLESTTHDDNHNHSEGSSLIADSQIEFPKSEYDAEIDAALASIAEGKKAEGMPMPAGILDLLKISRQDTNNVRANYYLTLFAIQSGQLEKAEKRLEKLILLQPENQKYPEMLAEVQSELNK